MRNGALRGAALVASRVRACRWSGLCASSSDACAPLGRMRWGFALVADPSRRVFVALSVRAQRPRRACGSPARGSGGVACFGDGFLCGQKRPPFQPLARFRTKQRRGLRLCSSRSWLGCSFTVAPGAGRRACGQGLWRNEFHGFQGLVRAGAPSNDAWGCLPGCCVGAVRAPFVLVCVRCRVEEVQRVDCGPHRTLVCRRRVSDLRSRAWRCPVPGVSCTSPFGDGS